MAGHKPTFASVTTKPCKCRWAEDVTAEPDNAVAFDNKANEYQFLTRKGGSLTIYHCPFCGGVMPSSRRAEPFAYITEVERQRLAALTSGLKSVADVIRVLGKPNRDHPSGLVVRNPAKGRHPPTVTSYRVLTYTRVSGTADVAVTDCGPDGIRFSFQGKYLRKRRGRRTRG
jgi:hypothetical protein